MPDMEQLKIKVNRLRMQKQKLQNEIDKHREDVDKLIEDREKIQKQIDAITGVNEESDAAITTTTAGNISRLGGSGNYPAKMGMVKRTKKKKRKNESIVIDYLDNLFE